MRKDRVYIALLVFSILAFVASELLEPEPVNWSDDYTRYETIPFAAKILHEELDAAFPGASISENNETLYVYDAEDSAPRNWIFINSIIRFDPYETEVILERIAAGDQVFIAGPVTGPLADSLNLEYDFFYSIIDSTGFTRDSLELRFYDDRFNANKPWHFNPELTFYYFTSYDSANTVELGGWDRGDMVNFIRTDIGEGSIYLNSTPKTFTNYYLRDPGYAAYAFGALSHLPVKNVIWDEYYKDGRLDTSTPMHVILNTKSLKYAWYVSILSILLFMIFKAKRTQRVIPILRAPENSSLNFARTIGELYLEQGTHKEILEKKLRFFYDYIKTHLRLDTDTIDDKFKTDLAFRSGITKQEAHRLFDLVELSENARNISDSELKLITDNIDQFYKNSQR